MLLAHQHDASRATSPTIVRHRLQLVLLLLLAGVALLQVVCSEKDPDIDAYKPSLCGRRSRQDWPKQTRRLAGSHSQRMSTGWLTGKDEMPWHVNIRSNPIAPVRMKRDCAGIIIHLDLVLTTADCVGWDEKQRVSTRRYVVAGTNSLSDMRDAQVREFVHPEDAYWSSRYRFERALVGNMSHNLAVIRVEQPFEYDDHVQPACLPSLDRRNIIDYKSCFTLGQGARTHAQTKEIYGYRLSRLMAMPLVSATCDEIAASAVKQDESCWVTANEQKMPGSPCPGDGGGGLYCMADNFGDQAMTAVGILTRPSALPYKCDEGVTYKALFLQFERQSELLAAIINHAKRTAADDLDDVYDLDHPYEHID